MTRRDILNLGLMGYVGVALVGISLHAANSRPINVRNSDLKWDSALGSPVPMLELSENERKRLYQRSRRNIEELLGMLDYPARFAVAHVGLFAILQPSADWIFETGADDGMSYAGLKIVRNSDHSYSYPTSERLKIKQRWIRWVKKNPLGPLDDVSAIPRNSLDKRSVVSKRSDYV